MGTVRMKTAIVLRLMDAVTQRPAALDKIAIQVRQQNRVVWKGPDCAVILDREGESRIDAVISGRAYQKVRLHIDLAQPGRPQVCHLWMQPSAGYPFTDDMAVIRGTCAAAGLYAVRRAAGCRLAETTAAGDNSLRLWGLDGAWEERTLLLCEGDQDELVTLVGQAVAEPGCRPVAIPVQKVFDRRRTTVCTVLKLCPGEDGSFVAAYCDIRAEGEQIFFRDSQGALSCLRIQKGGRYDAAAAQTITCSDAGIPWD